MFGKPVKSFAKGVQRNAATALLTSPYHSHTNINDTSPLRTTGGRQKLHAKELACESL